MSDINAYSISIFWIATACLDYLQEYFLAANIRPNLRHGASIQELGQATRMCTSPFEPLKNGLQKMKERGHKIPRDMQAIFFYSNEGGKWHHKNLCERHPPAVARTLILLREAFEAEEASPVSIDQAVRLMYTPGSFCFGNDEPLSDRAREKLAEHLGMNVDGEGTLIALVVHEDEGEVYVEFRVEGKAVFTLLPDELTTLKLVVRDRRLVAINE